MIKLRMDVDYPYPSRFQSFLATALGFRLGGKNYLKNSKILAKMINESPKEVKAYWFFTPYTTPDAELLNLLQPDRHEVALHVATKPYVEWERLEKATGRKVAYYTVHGTARLLARLMWRRGLRQAKAPIPAEFPLKSFYDFVTLDLDYICYHNSASGALKIAQESVEKGEVLHVHPEWLFQQGTLNHRGPYYDTLRTVLDVDKDLSGLHVHKKGLTQIAQFEDVVEYQFEHVPTGTFLGKLVDRDADLFTFIERKWCCNIQKPAEDWSAAEDNIALLQVTTYDAWWNSISKKTRNMVRKADKSGVTVTVTKPDEGVAEGVWRIYNDTPIRQGRAFSRYGISLAQVKRGLLSESEHTYILAYFQGELVGFIQLVMGDRIAIISQILALQKYWDKAVNNALVAKAIEVCAEKKAQYVMYGRMGNHPTLDDFKESNNFTKFPITRYYVPLTWKGQIAIKLNLHRDLKDTLPMWIKKPLFPVFSWVSRTKMKVRLMRHPR
jgi:hypothetical protein